MDNSVLQKLLHGHVLLKNDHNKFLKMFVPSSHIKTTDDGFSTNIPKSLMAKYLEFHANVFDKEHGKLRHWIPHLLSSPIKPWCFSQKAFTTNRLFIEKQVDVNNWIYEYNLK